MLLKMRSSRYCNVVLVVSCGSMLIAGYVYLGKIKHGAVDSLRQNSPGSVWISRERKMEVHMDNSGCWDRRKVIQEARLINRNNLTVMVTIVNDAFIDFSYSWLCNTESMNIQKQLLILTTNKYTEDALTRDWPQVKTMCLLDISSNGEQIYSNAGYVRLMAERTQLILDLLNENITLFLFEVDCVWLQNPLLEFTKFRNYDLIAVQVKSNTMRISVSGGYLVLFPKERTKKLWKKVTQQMNALLKKIEKYPETKVISRLENDQVYLSKLLSDNYANVNAKYISYNEYQDGRWYALPEKERKLTKPVVINNNWVEGTKAKIDRAKKWGHWFLNEDHKCDINAVEKLR